MASPLIGQTLGQYRILDEIGAGGMGVVYKAQDIRLGRMIALKVLPQSASAEEEAVERFRREARTASSLNHPNICTIYSFDDYGGQLYLAMELLDGEPLDKRLSGRALDLRTLLDVGIQIADALDAAHSEGILHRDIKPANIFLTRRGQVKVLDFGLAKLAPGHASYGFDAHPTQQFSSIAGTTVGTIAYMSPEQARGEDLDPRTDLFSFGVVLYEMATGRQSFPGATTAVVFDGILNRDPHPPSALNASIPHELDRIISKSLDKERALRYQTAADMRADLQRLKRDSGSRRVPIPPHLVDNSSAATVAFTPDPPTGVTPPADADSTRMWMPPATPSPSGATPAAPPSSSSGTTVPPLSHISSAPETPVAPQVSSTAHVPVAPLPSASAPRKKWGGLSPMTIAALVIFVVGIASMLVIARLLSPSETSAPVAEQTTAVPPVTPPAAPTNQSTASTEPVAAPSPPPATEVTNTTPTGAITATPPVAPTPANRAAASPTNRAAASPTKGSSTSPASTAAAAAAKNATAKGPLPKPIEEPAPPPPPPPPPPNPELEANTRLDAIRTKVAGNSFDPALADLRQLIGEFPGSAAAAEASYLIADVLEKQGRIDEAITAHTEFGKRFATHPRGAASRLRLAELVGRTRRSDREDAQRAIFAEVFNAYPRTPQALQALQLKLRLDGGRRQREMDPVLGVQVPAVVPTLRALTEQFSTNPIVMPAFARLAEAYEDLGQYARAAQAYTDLATNFPTNPHDAWYKAGEIYERRFKDMERARDAYSKVPAGSSRYRDAQRKLGNK